MSHNYEEALTKDEARQARLESFGIRFLRFSESAMKNDMLNVIRTIESTIIDIVKRDSTIKMPLGFDREMLK